MNGMRKMWSMHFARKFRRFLVFFFNGMRQRMWSRILRGIFSFGFMGFKHVQANANVVVHFVQISQEAWRLVTEGARDIVFRLCYVSPVEFTPRFGSSYLDLVCAFFCISERVRIGGW